MGAPDEAGGDNAAIAGRLRDYADVLEQQEADGFRVGAYRRAADLLDHLEHPVAVLFADGGREALMALPGIGPSIAAAIAQMLTTGRWPQLDRVRGQLDPESLFRTLPGIGPALARRLHEELHLDSLEALETAIHDGRAAGVAGMGDRRLRMLDAELAQRLGRLRLRARPQSGMRPSVALILDVDDEYRRKAQQDGRLQRIAPKRFNPSGEAWLPILHTRRGAWEFTALYSNTRLAHELDRIRDWVVIYFHTDTEPEGQCTVVTETRGDLAGRRVVRGREEECRAEAHGDSPAG